MKYFFFLSFAIIISHVCLSQDVNNGNVIYSIVGNVYFQNSAKKNGGIPLAAIDVHINANGANDGDRSKADGNFTLKFPSVTSLVGKSVKIFLGDEIDGTRKITAITKTQLKPQEIEWVNEDNFKYLTIPSRPQEMPLKIIVCFKGARDTDKMLFAKSYWKNQIEKYNKLLTEKDSLIKFDKNNFASISEKYDKLTRIQKGLNDSIFILNEALRLASINEDEASERTKLYLHKLRSGESLEEAFEVLSPESAETDYLRGKQRSENAIDELQTAMNNCISRFDIQRALYCCDKIVNLLSRDNKSNSLYYANFIKTRCELNIKYGNKKEGLNDCYEALKIIESQSSNLVDKIGINQKLLNYYQEIENKDSISAYVEKLTRFFKALQINQFNDIKGDTTGLGCLLNVSKELMEVVMKYTSVKHNGVDTIEYLKCISKLNQIITVLDNELYRLDGDMKLIYQFFISILYVAISDIYSEFPISNSNSISYLIKGSDVLKNIGLENSTEMANVIDKLASRYSDLELDTMALVLQCKSQIIKEDNLDPNDILLSKGYFKLSKRYYAINALDSALYFAIKGVKIEEKVLVPSHIDLSKSYRYISKIYKENGNTDLGLKYQNMSLNILTNQAEYNKSEVSEEYNQIGFTYYGDKNYDSAIRFYQIAWQIDSISLGNKYYNNMGTALVKKKNFSEAKIYFQKFEKQTKDIGRVKRNWAMYYALSGNKEKAFTYLLESIKNGYKNLNWFETDDSIDSLRSDEQYKEIIEQVKAK